jgi:phosphoglycolate phosphatase-like HAD superfamily hydrolase
VLALDGLLVDLDGCVWVGGEPLPGAVEALRLVHRHGLELAFVTNDPASTRAEHAARLTRLGVPTPAERVVTAAWALAATVARTREPPAPSVPRRCHDPRGRGGRGRGRRGCERRPRLRAADRRDARRARWRVPLHREPRPVVPDARRTVARQRRVRSLPGGGDRRRRRRDRQPEPALFTTARQELGDAQRVAVVGDRRDADVAGGRRAGLTTILVGEGQATGPVPDHHVAGLHALPALLGLVDAG